ncbi:hypothetical protein EG850_11080 [Gulosibacter macacae]|uniref:Uncharacterized protein n=1 Tax=Gulosibacter macacae TaxID=2488791 RepID=A0A3P3VSZ6_9MICO|nr:hypothetical protein [Gulosibacter macacae]RRJ85921.1 hypothetical protein EG850_11080 [Gulosibacter macacae]
MSSDEAFGWRITDEEWREFQEIPEQGFSHRAWVDCRLQQRIEWQANRDAVRIAELEAEIEGIKRRDAEVGEDEGWWVGGAWGDYGEAVVPLRILSYVIDGKLDEKVTSIDPGFALTYAEQTARAEDAEAKLAEVRAYCIENTEGMPDDPFAYGIQELRRVLALLDGGDET